ncbi:hypothetical protein DFQ28_006454 [Apophysomyces sp. BC1034]|nr:hypothetical protein DFQ30_004319 [Apophysomyces sp. BC1015]KAG0182471.1 hypothetical protein DFQ29_003900 [Apophysomyces sp. BC1021]KAG0193079.1 hypothetical protein DFQ28_006454 [Apophysomyces sp. BC1034]
MATSPLSTETSTAIPAEAAFSIMFVSVGMSCFIWQSIRSGWMLYKARKPIQAIVFAQAMLGVVVTFVTLLASLIEMDCNSRLFFSVIGVNLGDIALQSVLLWKAYIGNNRSKAILVFGAIPIVALVFFIGLNLTIGRSSSFYGGGVCMTEYPMYIVIIKATIDFTSNTFLSLCFLLVINRYYRFFGKSIQRMLLKEGLIYCFGVCISNIVTGILLTQRVLGGATPIIYTIDWYLASYLIIKQVKYGRADNVEEPIDLESSSDLPHHDQGRGDTEAESDRGLSVSKEGPGTDTCELNLTGHPYHSCTEDDGHIPYPDTWGSSNHLHTETPTLTNNSSFRWSSRTTTDYAQGYTGYLNRHTVHAMETTQGNDLQ